MEAIKKKSGKQFWDAYAGVKTYSLKCLNAFINPPDEGQLKAKERELMLQGCIGFDVWKIMVKIALQRFMDSSSISILMDFCNVDCCANYHFIFRKDCKPYPGLFHKLLKGRASFGDIVSVVSPGCDPTLFIVDEVNMGLPVLMHIDSNDQGQIDIPMHVAQDLCDPVEFYQMGSSAMPFLGSIRLPFGHRCVRKILGINRTNKSYFADQSEFFEQSQTIISFDKVRNLSFLFKIGDGHHVLCPRTGQQRYQICEDSVECVIREYSSSDNSKVIDCLSMLYSSLENAAIAYRIKEVRDKKYAYQIASVLQIVYHVKTNNAAQPQLNRIGIVLGMVLRRSDLYKDIQPLMDGVFEKCVKNAEANSILRQM